MKPIVKRLAFGLFGFVLIWTSVWLVGYRWGFTPLPKPPSGVRIKPLLPPLARKDLTADNGASYYVKAADLVRAYKQSKESKEQSEAVLEGDFSKGTNAIKQTLMDCRAALDLGLAGSKANFCQMPLVTETPDSAFLGGLRALARLILVDGKLAQEAGDPGRAITDYLTVVKLGTDCSRGGALIQSLVGVAIVDMGARATRAWVLRPATAREPLAGIRETLSSISQGRVAYPETLRDELEYEKREFSRQLLAEAGPWGAVLWSKRVSDRCLEAALGDLIQESDKPYWETDTRKITKKWDPEERRGLDALNRPGQRILIAMILPAIEDSRKRVVRSELDLTATEIICALKTYALTHGFPPERLDELVPDLLPAILIDPFDGKPLRYRRDGKEWVLWSVGSDLKDDKAAWHEYKYRKPGEDRKGGDIYFKSTEPQDDLAFYRSQQEVKSSRPARSDSSPTAAP
ncbi:MAG TPA: hypothetical protein VMV72_10245 [Verrucomicrobiae bacterium]|nr:hypothetical protein [Verrucomicrobiae bacterium]